MARRLLLFVLVSFAFFVLPASQAWAANKFWVGGTGNLDGVDTTHISNTTGGAGGAVYPGVGDTLIFDASSGGGTVTFTAAASFAGITNGAHTGSIDTNGQTITLSGTWNGSGSGVRTLNLSSSIVTVGTWNFGTVSGLTFSAGTSAITQGPSAATFSGGSLSYSSVSLITTGVSIVTGTTNSFSTLSLSGSGAAVTQRVTFPVGTQAIGNFSSTGVSAQFPLWINGSYVQLANLTHVPVSIISAASATVSNSMFRGISAQGVASWDFSARTDIGNFGVNAGITFPASLPRFWVGGTGNWSDPAHWADSSGGAGGTRIPLSQDDVFFDSASFTAPGQQVVQDFVTYGRTVSFSGVTNNPTIKAVVGTWTNCGGLILSAAMTFEDSAVTLNGCGGVGSKYQFDGAGKTWAGASLVFAGTGSTYVLSSALTATAPVFVSDGILDLGGFGITVGSLQVSGFGFSPVAYFGSSTLVFNGNSNSLNVASGGTVYAESSTIRVTGALTAARTFNGGGGIFGRVEILTTGAFPNQVAGSSEIRSLFIDASAAARTVNFTAGTVTRIGALSRDAGTNTITIGSITAANHMLVNTSGAPLTIHHASISRSDAVSDAQSVWLTPIRFRINGPAYPTSIGVASMSGGSGWYATSSTDGGNNSGWTITP